METIWAVERQNFTRALETFLVEWKLGTERGETPSGESLETFLVEWKPDPGRLDTGVLSGLETFLVMPR